jgi:hypothetical protein
METNRLLKGMTEYQLRVLCEMLGRQICLMDTNDRQPVARNGNKQPNGRRRLTAQEGVTGDE